ncbi:MAG: mechanosensitive ion channel family protein [Deltaproteobacteria bacterium]|nr:mechanosensitive ion channel family protein [Deltaproteobacteria bacterium]
MQPLLTTVSGDLIRNAAVSASILVASFIVLLIVRKVVFKSFSRWARATDTKADDILLEALKYPSIFWAAAVSLYIALDTSAVPQKYVNYGLEALYVLIILSVTLATANIVSNIVQNALQRKSAAGTPVTGLSRAVIKASVFVIGGLVIANSIGISITPMLTALGVGGLAVALALQDTLSNLFAGMHILVEAPVRVGDYIKLETGEEGFVVDIGWRTTRIRQLANNIVIIPNNKLAQSNITNYCLPEKRMSLLINIGVAYDCDPERVEAVLLEEATAAASSGEVPGLLSTPEPFVRFIPGFGDSSLNFTLICQVGEFVDQYLAQHELRKRIFKRFRKEGIEIPFPQRTVHLKQG